jgi:hypothetical protein
VSYRWWIIAPVARAADHWEAAMDREQFWALVEAAKAAAGGNCDRQAELLELALRRLPAAEIVAFAVTLEGLLAQSKRIELWGAADLIVNQCSEDGFEYFCGWLVSQGRGVYEAALADPDWLADYPGLGDGSEVDCEAIWCAADRAHQARTGRQLPDEVYSGLPLIGTWWPSERHAEETRRRDPKLWQRFGERYWATPKPIGTGVEDGP